MLVKSQVKYIQSLGQKKSRDEEGLFIAEGPKIVRELLQEIPSLFQAVYAVPGWIETQQTSLPKAFITEVSENELGRISQLSTPNQVLAVIRKMETPASIATAGQLTLALDTIQDPGNLGTIIRIADWFGIRQIVCSTDCADQYNPKVVQSTMASLARVQLLYTDLAAWLASQKDTRIYAAQLEGEDITGMQKIKEGIIIIGNESKGISDAVQQQVNVRITIPKIGKAESLNAAVATGIILSHLR
jgi:RNA methyltransferase, TrmH family